MKTKKSESNQEKDKTQETKKESSEKIIVEETENQPNQAFKVSDQEEIEYLQKAEEERTAPCAAAAEPGASEEELIKKLETELELKEKELAQFKSLVEEFKDKYLRALAELDNVRKRTEKEKEEFYQFALSDLFKEILTVIDNFERALKTSDEETDGKTLREGVELIYRMLLNLIKKFGVTPIELKDNKFNPAIHQALASEESEEVSEPEVKEELQKGYFIHNRLLRPTMVKVIIPKKN
jgi:molecular chaperone GrpE